MKLEVEKIVATATYPQGTTITDVIVDMCDKSGFNTIYDDGDEVVMRNGQYLAFVNIDASNIVHTTFYRN